ncbi:dimethylaniline monooxygenase (N-oxide forming) [Mytilus galloprovincialis]|uniref:Flavin-containing monooxygenase n=1 Tax=Mytilus galloprovincialis TaxID=29158 RepID=A0A8B6GFF2_MYTGA|nr:dimethylaniline monooxygenase (N-oxide forming) [Mytilus galloprovincialis]
MKVAVIGAGVSGLAAIKCCIDEGLDSVCFERTDDIGGLWRYSDKVTEGQTCVMKSTITNISKEMMCYSDFPMPAEYPMFLHNTYVQKYLNLYAEKFSLRKYIQFETEILSVMKNDDFKLTGRWVIKLKDKKTGKVKENIFDAVLVCTGRNSEKYVPNFQGLPNFKGEVVHSHDYRMPTGYEGKRILVIGIGNSGSEIAVELSEVASQVFISTSRGSWVFPRITDYGMPIDMTSFKRIMIKLKQILPQLIEYLVVKKANARFDHTNYCLQPKHGVFTHTPIINDEIPKRLASGTLQVKPDVRTFTENGVIFDDNTVEENLDVVVLATGYAFKFPFLDKSATNVKENHVDALYKFIFPPKLEKSTLGIIGCTHALGPNVPVYEMQCRLSTRVLQGKVTLPCYNEMMLDIESKQKALKQKYVKTHKHTVAVEYIEYMDELATLNGCRPDLGMS